jgi:hypothetical protein
LWKGIKAAQTNRDKLLFTLLFEHGLRTSEGPSLTRAHVSRGYLQIRGKKKSRRADEKLNPVTLAPFESVTKTLLPRTLIFPFSRQWNSVPFHRACDKAGITLQLQQGLHSLGYYRKGQLKREETSSFYLPWLTAESCRISSAVNPTTLPSRQM